MLAPAVREPRLQVRHIILTERVADDPHGAAVFFKQLGVAGHGVSLLGGQAGVKRRHIGHIAGGRAISLHRVALRGEGRHVQRFKNTVQPIQCAHRVPVGVRLVVEQPVRVLARLTAQQIIPPHHRHRCVALQVGCQQVGTVLLVHDGVAVRHILLINAVLAGRQIQHQRAAVFCQPVI